MFVNTSLAEFIRQVNDHLRRNYGFSIASARYILFACMEMVMAEFKVLGEEAISDHHFGRSDARYRKSVKETARLLVLAKIQHEMQP